MDGNEKLPQGWVKVQSKSRPDKVYFYNIETGVSLWKIEDLKKLDQGRVKSAKRQSPTKPAAMTVKKSVSGVANESKVIKKNGAKERMTKLQKKLSDDIKRGENSKDPEMVKKKPPEKVVKQAAVKEVRKVPEDKKNVAAQRMKKLNKELKREEDSGKNSKKPESLPKSKVPLKRVNNELPKPETKNIPEEVELMDVSYEENQSEELDDYALEPMDWEEIPEEKIILEVQKIRTTNLSAEVSSFSPRRPFNSSTGDFFIVVDTNVLLSNIEFLREIKGKMFKDIGKATIFLPYIVLCELDRLKTHEERVSLLARRSIAFIDECFKEKDDFFIGQSGIESIQKQLIPIDSGDDEILNCCLQIQETTKQTILLTNDKNLRNKAFVNRIESFSRDMLKFVDYNSKNDIKFD